MDLDKVDIRILNLLQEDARLSFREIARRTEVSTPTVSARVKRFEELGIIQGYHAHLATSVLGAQTYHYLITTAPVDMAGTALRLAGSGHINDVNIVGGGRILIRAVIASQHDRSRLHELLTAMPEIRHYDEWETLEIIKDLPIQPIPVRASMAIPCVYCGRTGFSEPVHDKVGDRHLVFCCTSCQELYRKRHQERLEGSRRWQEVHAGANPVHDHD